MRKQLIKQRVIEINRAKADYRDELSRLDSLSRQLRACLDQRQRAWDQGFACAIDMFARGATLEDMRAKVRRPQEVPVLARGTRDLTETELDTQPVQITGENEWRKTWKAQKSK